MQIFSTVTLLSTASIDPMPILCAPCSLQWKCGLLQQLADLTLKQNDEKTATLQQLLKSESILYAEAAAGAAASDAL